MCGAGTETAGADLAADWPRYGACAQPDTCGPEDRAVLSATSRRESKRIVWPVTVGYMRRSGHLIAWCELRQDFRSFRTTG